MKKNKYFAFFNFLNKKKNPLVFFLTTLFIFCFIPFLWGQNETANRDKYWHFRDKLVKQFVKVGHCQGCSVPAEKYEIVSIVLPNGKQDTIRRLNFGADATAHLGWYMGVLATEYYLLKKENQSTQNTERELYFALLAFDRLDANAELVAEYRKGIKCQDPSTEFFDLPVKWDKENDRWLPLSEKSLWADSANNLNGYFLRMDGSPALFAHFNEANSVNAGLTRPKLLYQNEWATYEFAPDKITYSTAGYRKGNNETSQDQVFHLLMGLMLVREFASEAHYQTISLGDKAIATGKRILSNYSKNFQLKNPVTQKTVCVGGNSAVFGPSLHKLMDYFWSDGQKKNNANTQSYLKAPFTSVCATNGEVNRSLFAVLTALSNTTSHAAMCNYVTKQGYYWGFYYLLRKALHPHAAKNACDYSFEDVVQDLNNCPKEGAYWNDAYFRAHPAAITNWTFSNRYLHQCRPQYLHPDWEFNNLDYMLLYNLARIVYAEGFESAYQEM